MMSVAIEFKNVSKKFDKANYNAVDDISFTVNEGELVTILGSSGSGKTTLLRLTNRLIDPDKGEIILFGENIKTVDVIKVRRRIGYVIQQIGLFPHMNIKENISVVCKLMKWEESRIDARVDELLNLVGLDPKEYKYRFPKQLSGGQQQRIGLARALAIDPKIMLLDEPFGAIDSITRLKLQDELLSIHGGLKKTFLFVTHDIEEAFKMGNRVMIMNEGKIIQFDTPENIIKNPKDEFVKTLMNSAKEKTKLWEKYI
ncbi:MAG: ABC transporter ATP-binding protein [Erysipelotrichaceae bacterium]|nr:ABC transporter ATP-binding protein [Erysipelotrichaceae bacterium]